MKFKILLIFLFPFMTYTQTPFIKYFLSMPKPSNHLFDVSIQLDNLTDNYDTIDFVLPVWRPGRYLIFDFASGVQQFEAMDNNNSYLHWRKVDKCTWRVYLKNTKSVKVKYKVFADEFHLRTRGLNDEHGFVNGTAVFMYVDKFREEPIVLEVIPYNSWHITTGLPRETVQNNIFFAEDYDQLADCPLEIGNQTDIEFYVNQKKHIISIFGNAVYDREKLINDFTKIIEMNLKFWGKIPYDEYYFLIHCTPNSSGGTEHINSTVVGVRPLMFTESSTYNSMLQLISHEFFHTWNVKQFRPKGLTPYDYTKENYTEELWIAEGGTSYYDGLLLLRSKLINVDDFLKQVTKSIQEDRRRPGNRKQSLAESSFDSWIKFWKNTEQSYNTETNYYSKGANISLILDLYIRYLTQNKYSLDDVYLNLYETFPYTSSGYTNTDFKNICEKFTSTDLSQFFKDYVYGTREIGWEIYLSYAGLELISEDSTMLPIVGIFPLQRGDKIIIDEVITGSSADEVGLMAGDEIVAVDYERMNFSEMENKIKELKINESVVLTIFRSNKMKEFKITLNKHKVPNYKIVKVKSPSDLQRNIYENWLKRSWEE